MSLIADNPAPERLPSVHKLCGFYGQAVSYNKPKKERDIAARRLALGMAFNQLRKTLKKYEVQLTKDEADIAALEIDHLVKEGK